MEQVAISLGAYIYVKTGIFANAVENSMKHFFTKRYIMSHYAILTPLLCVFVSNSSCLMHIFNSIISFDKKDIFPCWKTSFYLPKV